MTLVKIILLIICTILPYLLGCGLCAAGNKSVYLPVVRWCVGWAALYGLFYLPALVCSLLRTSLTLLTCIYLVLLAAALFASLMALKKRGEQLFPALPGFFKDGSVYEVIAGLFVVLHALLTFLLQHIDDDDFSYVGTASTSYVTDTLMIYNGGTGLFLTDISADGMNRLIAAPQYAFYAFLARIGGIGPAVLCHSVLPPVFTVLFAGALLMLAEQFFDTDREHCGMFLILAFVLTVFSDFSSFSAGSFMTLRSWQGKAQIVGLILPLVLWFWLRVLKEGDLYGREILLLTTVFAAASLQTAMGAALTAMASGILMVTAAVMQRKMALVRKALPAYAVPLLCAAVYLAL